MSVHNAIICRDFWPHAGAIGEGLLRAAELEARDDKKTLILTMSADRLDALYSERRCDSDEISFLQSKPLTTSNSAILLRILECFIFALWVFFKLVFRRPNNVYVTSNPPILVPLTVSVYANLFKKTFIYHIQDIHPEAGSLFAKFPKWVVELLIKVDNYVLNSATALLTITDEMRDSIVRRGVACSKVELIDNPALITKVTTRKKISGFVFCGNAGRLQILDILLPAIEAYLKAGGALHFCFVGSGVYWSELERLDCSYDLFQYRGYVAPELAQEITGKFEWALLPIDSRVLKYAFPSKTPTYVSAGCKILSISSSGSPLANMIELGGFGLNVEPNVHSITNVFHRIERGEISFAQQPSRAFPSVDDFAINIQRIFRQNDTRLANELG